jgi:3-hydroxyisobutyrate dehydrogenase
VEDKLKIGFIGLGTMGAHMARRLRAAGHELVVNDVRREAADDLVAAGAVWASSPSDVAAGIDVLFTSLPGPPEVEAVGNAILEAKPSNLVWFDLSTNSPKVVADLHRRCTEAGCTFLDAPVSGGPGGAAAGKLTIWIGGD